MVLGLEKQFKTMMSGPVDRLALLLMSRFFLGRHKPDLSETGLARARRAYEVYGRKELRDHPERLYRTPDPVPRKEVKSSILGLLPAGQKLLLSFPSGYSPHDQDLEGFWQSLPANRTVHAVWWRHFGPRPPCVVCIHGWAGGWAALEERAFGFAELYRRGLDCLLMILPFHASRADPPRTSAPVFPSTRVDVTVEAVAQSVWDFRRLHRHLREDRGVFAVSAAGWSLGGVVAGLLAFLDPDLLSIAVMSPAVSMAELLWRHGEGYPERKRVEEAGYTFAELRDTWAVVSPLSFPLSIPPKRLLILAGKRDRICTPKGVVQLARHWGSAEIRWYDGGHLLHPDRTALISEMAGFFLSCMN